MHECDNSGLFEPNSVKEFLASQVRPITFSVVPTSLGTMLCVSMSDGTARTSIDNGITWVKRELPRKFWNI